ncbi:hypothetical protein PCH_Pc13g01330 [Penicillium rubens Wisconsin 54-1255]|uniref:Uncharacterized protein n=1 Tax=Penicillium rubens (strain ATCC 28089 / DSM 1075 / NRRL 1951 / Wisconsin 54-1255) TaxID=500485 RepID=B6H1P8_PENRW|nr:hypothetical protein PCH_Pc13g01330 [Penicillium rubens Wisconsin 54-1255]
MEMRPPTLSVQLLSPLLWPIKLVQSRCGSTEGSDPRNNSMVLTMWRGGGLLVRNHTDTVYDGPGIEPAPDIENWDNKRIYVRVIEWTAGQSLRVEGKSGCADIVGAFERTMMQVEIKQADQSEH